MRNLNYYENYLAARVANAELATFAFFNNVVEYKNTFGQRDMFIHFEVLN